MESRPTVGKRNGFALDSLEAIGEEAARAVARTRYITLRGPELLESRAVERVGQPGRRHPQRQRRQRTQQSHRVPTQRHRPPSSSATSASRWAVPPQRCPVPGHHHRQRAKHGVLDQSILLPAIVHAGNGDDIPFAGGGPTVLLGGSGNDKLIAGSAPTSWKRRSRNQRSTSTSNNRTASSAGPATASLTLPNRPRRPPRPIPTPC